MKKVFSKAIAGGAPLFLLGVHPCIFASCQDCQPAKPPTPSIATIVNRDHRRLRPSSITTIVNRDHHQSTNRDYQSRLLIAAVVLSKPYVEPSSYLSRRFTVGVMTNVGIINLAVGMMADVGIVDLTVDVMADVGIVDLAVDVMADIGIVNLTVSIISDVGVVDLAGYGGYRDG